ncbi:Hypothetical predicted protein [Mytilus galloprovincialis]|uniref:Uncharacterized protein n=2 Tax=Mytilus galloprovincialis TaxID=29158 RepID=A0A8B6C3G0_MYTGA|nr:Hypothetical predicted protein [Mytilus galloprovincialis]
MHANILIYLMLFIYDFSAGMTEFPCKYPCPWRNKTFIVYQDGDTFLTWKFDNDGETSMFGPIRYLCHQITERFLIMRVAGNDFFRCVSIFYDIGSPLKFPFQYKDKYLKNQIGDIKDVCEACVPPMHIYEAVVSGSPPTSPAVNSLPCDMPSTCTRTTGIPCSKNDTIPKGCLVTTTEPIKTTTEPAKNTKRRCRKKNHIHTK